MINLENIFPDSTAELLKGGKAAAIGEIREFGGKKYKKTSNGWRPVPKKESVVKEPKEETISSSVSKIIDGFKSINSKYSDRDKMSLKKTGWGNWHLYYDGKDTGSMMNFDVISEEEAKKAGFIKQIESQLKEKDREESDLLEKINKIESDFQNQLTKLIGDKIPISRVSVNDESITIVPKGSTYGVEAFFRKNYKTGERMEYKVLTISHGTITPDSPNMKDILLQVELLTNKSLIKLAKDAMIKVSSLND